MADIRSTLHDEIDQIEGLKDQARQIVAAVVKEKLDEIVASSPDMQTAFKRLADEVEGRLAELTTEAFKTGAGFSVRRFGG